MRLLAQEIASGSGSYLASATGERFLDFTSGIGVTNTGHCHPRVVAAAQEQLDDGAAARIKRSHSKRRVALEEGVLRYILLDPARERRAQVEERFNEVGTACHCSKV